ncbi:hypothetical protein CHS0354_026959 [Potamilus streckersoni]|uniref:Tonsoku-like protein n=1 Tax=Potamilus streckersoni TaxID=2493646 RepID=A0AAE0VUC5_9BIVA|nr:hypothetical protein CHS0354_026959 [Potamilus streckersoni]
MDYSDKKEYERLLKEKRKAEKNENFKELALICNCLGELLAKYEKWEEAIMEHETERGLSEALNDPIGTAVACRKLGECYCSLQEFVKALELQNQHLTLAKSCNNTVEEQRALATIGRTYFIQYESCRTSKEKELALRKAKEAFLKSLEVCEQLKDTIAETDYQEMRGRLFLNLGLVSDEQSDMDQCTEYMQKAVTITHNHKLYSDVIRCQFSLATIYSRMRKHTQALRSLEEASKCAQILKDKHTEAEVCLSKALILTQIQDFQNARHCLKKANKLGLPSDSDRMRIKIYYKAVVRMEEAMSDLKETGDLEKQCKLYEKIADNAADIGNYKQALEFYLKVVSYMKTLGKPEKDLIPIYVSLAQTYKDDKQFSKAIEHYKLEVSLQGDNFEQICRSWLNIAEAQELEGKGYKTLSESFLTAYEFSRKAKHRRLQVQCLMSLVEIQKYFKQENHRRQTEEKLKRLREKYGITSDEEDDSQPREEDVDEEEIVMSDLSDSSDEEEPVSFTAKSSPGCSMKRDHIRRNDKGETPLHRACISNNFKKVKALVEAGHPMNPRDHCGWIPLHEACNHGHYEIVEFLLNHGADINDRGTAECRGVTPLIDAASCGHVDVMNLLIERGANVIASTDEGDTALSSFQDYVERNKEYFCKEDMVKAKNMENLLLEKMPHHMRERKVKRLQVSRTDQDNEEVSDDELPTLSQLKQKKDIQKKLKPLSFETDSDDSSHIAGQRSPLTESQDIDSEDSEMIFTNPALEEIKRPMKNAKEEYKNAINKVGSSGSRISQSPALSHVSHRTSNPNSSIALIAEEKFIGDNDWLIDDMQPSKKRKRDVEGFFSSKTARNKRPKDDSNMKSCKKMPLKSYREKNSFTGDQDFFGNDSDEIGDNNSQDHHSQNNDIAFINDVYSDFCDITNGMDSHSSESQKGDKSTKGRLIQSTLSQFTEKVNFRSEVNLNTFDARPPVDEAELPIISTMVKTDVMRIKVRIKDKLLLVPIQDRDGSKTVSWLSAEASQRYCTLTGIRPTLTLSTKDGAILSPDDPITLVLTGNDEIDAAVENWDLPPLAERYTQACKALGLVAYINVKNFLQTCDRTAKLGLQNLSLKPNHFQPISRALQCQTRLRELDLQGNKLGDVGVESLVKALETLPNLNTLTLACNEITSVGLKNLSRVFTVTAIDGNGPADHPRRPLQLLNSLNLSHNPLGDSCITSLSCLIENLPELSHLGIAACDLSMKLFQQHRIFLTQALHKSPLQELDVSYNKFGSIGIELLLKCLDHKKMTVLDLSSTSTGSSQPQICMHLHRYLSQHGCALRKLDISDLHLNADDHDFIIRIPVTGKHIHTLSMCTNPKLGNSILQGLLREAKTEGSLLEYINADGCGIQSPLDVGFMDAVNDKLYASVPLRSLSFTCQKLDKLDCDSLQQIWTERWKDLAEVSFGENSVRLNVTNW